MDKFLSILKSAASVVIPTEISLLGLFGTVSLGAVVLLGYWLFVESPQRKTLKHSSPDVHLKSNDRTSQATSSDFDGSAASLPGKVKLPHTTVTRTKVLTLCPSTSKKLCTEAQCSEQLFLVLSWLFDTYLIEKNQKHDAWMNFLDDQILKTLAKAGNSFIVTGLEMDKSSAYTDLCCESYQKGMETVLVIASKLSATLKISPQPVPLVSSSVQEPGVTKLMYEHLMGYAELKCTSITHFAEAKIKFLPKVSVEQAAAINLKHVDIDYTATNSHKPDLLNSPKTAVLHLANIDLAECPAFQHLKEHWSHFSDVRHVCKANVVDSIEPVAVSCRQELEEITSQISEAGSDAVLEAPSVPGDHVASTPIGPDGGEEDHTISLAGDGETPDLEEKQIIRKDENLPVLPSRKVIYVDGQWKDVGDDSSPCSSPPSLRAASSLPCTPKRATSVDVARDNFTMSSETQPRTAGLLDEHSSCALHESDSVSLVSGISGSSTRTYLGEASTLVLETLTNGTLWHYLIPQGLVDSSKLKKKGKKLHLINDHVFVARHLPGGSRCHVCGKSLARLPAPIKQGYECRDCHLRCHKPCHVRVETQCPSSTVHTMDLKIAEVSADGKLRFH